MDKQDAMAEAAQIQRDHRDQVGQAIDAFQMVWHEEWPDDLQAILGHYISKGLDVDDISYAARTTLQKSHVLNMPGYFVGVLGRILAEREEIAAEMAA